MQSINKKSLLELIAALPEGEQKRTFINQLLTTGELVEEDVAVLVVKDIANNSAVYNTMIAGDPLLAFLWQRFGKYPRYLARALVRVRPDIFYSYGFAARLIMKLRADLGPVLIPPVRPSQELPMAAEYMDKLPELVQRDLFELDTECQFREALFFLSRDERLGFEFLEEAITHAETEYDQRVYTHVHSYAAQLLELSFPDFVSEFRGYHFPSFHVRWWIDRVRDTTRVLNLGDTGTHKTAFATIAAHHYGCRKVLVLCPSHARPNWAREIAGYFEQNGKDRVLLVRDRAMVDQVWKSEAQYIVLGYSTLIQDNAVEVLKAIPFDGLTWDECHYGNNIGGSSPAKRAADCAELIQSLPLKRLIALSATPWENEVGEFGAVASTLRPDIFLTAESFKRARVHDPRLLREFFSSSIVEVELHEVRDLPPITPKPWEDLFGATTITMTGEHQEIYTRVREDEEVVLPAAQKVGRLLLTATHPHQIKRHYVWGETQKSFFTTWQLSSKLHWLKEKVTKKLAEGAKVVVATGIYAEGVTRPAEDEESEIWVGQVLKEWFGESQVIILDGTITQTVDATGTSERDRLIRRWRSDPETRVLLISMRACPDSVNLSVPALPGITKLFITALCYPWVPWKQFLGRFWRDGQGVEVEYVVPVLQETIDEALLRLVSRKWQIQQLFRAQVPLTDEEWQYLDGKIDLRRLAEESRSDTEKVNIIGALVQGRGEKAAANVLSDTYGTSSNGEVFARAFLAVQEYSTSGNIARFMRPIIEKYFEQGLVHAEGILDAGCGPLTLERYLNKPVYGVDLNPHVLRLAKSHSAHQGRNARAGVLSTLPQEWTGKFELTVTSLVLDWTSLAKTPSTPSSSERLGIIAELVRVTHPQGRIWITATHKSMNEEILDTWVRTLQAQGFHIIEELTGLVRATDIDRGDRPFMFWSLCFVPNGKPFTSREADAFRFVFETERTKVKRGGEGERSEPKHKREPHHLFEIIERSGRIQTTDKAALEVATHEVERLAQLADLKGWRFHHPPTIALDWRLLASLHARGTLDEELRRRGLIS